MPMPLITPLGLYRYFIDIALNYRSLGHRHAETEVSHGHDATPTFVVLAVALLTLTPLAQAQQPGVRAERTQSKFRRPIILRERRLNEICCA